MSARSPLTAEALDAYGEDDHVELIDGELVIETMTSFEHGDAQMSLGGTLKRYFGGNVPHYWLVDLEEPLLTVLRYHPDGYLIVATARPGERSQLEPFAEVELEVSGLFGDPG